MGGAVSSGESNNELVDNLMEASYIKSRDIEQIFRAVDRGFYFTKQFRYNAYKDLAWKDGNLHISAPCIYSEVLENLKLKRGMSFLNIGSGTGYLSTVVGLVLGKNGINHGIEIHHDVVQYAKAKLEAFMRSSPAIDIFDFSVPEFVVGNCLDTAVPNSQRYDRIYCGAGCGGSDVKFILELLKVGGVCILPMNDSLVQITRSSGSRIETKTLLPVSFASLIPSSVETKTSVTLPPWNAKNLFEICRSEIRDILRRTISPLPLKRESPEPLGEEERKKKRKKRNERRRASRLLLVQRRRNGEREGAAAARNPGFVAIAYSIGDHSSSSDEDEGGRCRSRCSHTKCSNNRPSPHNNKTDSTTDDVEVSKEGETVTVAAAASSSSSPAGTNGSPVRRSLAVSNGNGRAGGGGEGLSSSSEEPPSRRPRTELILERIREIIHNRQREDRDVRREPEGGEVVPVPQDDDCMWSTDDTSSSSFTLTSTSEDDSEDLDLEEVNGGRGEELDINDLEGNIQVNSSSDDDDDTETDMEELPMNPERGGGENNNSSGKTNIETEIEALNTEIITPIIHPTSISLAKKINQLDLPLPVKKFLNYERQL